MRRGLKLALIFVALLSFGVALSYPVRYYLASKSNEESLTQLSRLHAQALPDNASAPEVEGASDGRIELSTQTLPEDESATARIGATSAREARAQTDPEGAPAPSHQAPPATQGTAEAEPQIQIAPEDTAAPTTQPGPEAGLDEDGPGESQPAAPEPTANRHIRGDAVPYPMKEKVELDEARILPELREIYALNRDLVGWISIEGTVIDYPVVQRDDNDYYLDHDFYGNENANGQIILDARCDPYTPSYNLVISGHKMRTGAMFGGLARYQYRSYWETHKLVRFSTLMERKTYVVLAAFLSADYDRDEAGFRYNADIQYRIEAERWLDEVWKNQLYDTGVDAAFGDEFLTLTTCERGHHENGRFVLVCRKLRDGENIE